MITDPIADMLTRLRNAAAVGHEKVEISYSKQKKAILNIFAEYGFISSVETKKAKDGDYEIIEAILVSNKKINPKRISSPGRRVNVNKDGIRKVKNGLGLVVISTSQGVMSGDEAIKKGLGGEVVCEIC